MQFSLLDRRPLTSGLVSLCMEHGIKILAYGVLAGGFLAGRWLGVPRPDTEVRGDVNRLKGMHAYCMKDV